MSDQSVILRLNGDKFRFFALVLTLFLLASAMPGRAFAQKMADSVKIAVLPFEVNAEEELSYLKSSLVDLLADKLAEAGFEVVPRDKVSKVIADQKVEMLDLQMARDLALLSGATYSVYGTFNQVGGSISLDVRLVEAFGLQPAVPLFVTKQGLINLMPAIDELVGKIKIELMRKERIADIVVDGTQVLDKDVVLTRLGLKKGDIYDPEMLNKDLKAIYSLGYFDDVKVRVQDVPEGKRLVITVKEKPRLQELSVEGADEIDPEDIIGAMSTKKGAVLNPKVLSDDLNIIREMYRKKGYYNAKVDHEIIDPGTHNARLVIKVDEGKKLYIKEIVIKGAKAMDPDDVKDELALKEENWLSWITQEGVLKEDMLERDAAAIEAFYSNRGFVDVRVGQPEIEIQEDGLIVTFTVDEGPRYLVGEVFFKGDLIASEDTLKDLVGMNDLSEGQEYFDRSILRQDITALTEYYTNFGYAYAEVDATYDKDEENKLLNITFLLSKHQKVFIRQVLVEGNSRTRDNVILREMRLTDGDMFNGYKLRRSAERLNRLEFFEEVDIAPVPTGDPNQMDLRVKVKDKSTGMISGGVGYSSYEQIFISAKVEERNFLGKGYDLALQSAWSGKGTRYNLSFMNPHVNDSKWAAGFDLYYMTKDWNDYKKESVGGKIKAGHPLGEYTRAYLTYKLERYHLYDVDDEAADVIRDSMGENWASVVTATVTRDTTDRRFNPTRGTINTFEFDYGGGLLLGNDNFLKYIYDFSYYTPVWWEFIFHFHAQIGLVHQNFGDDDVPVFERFYLGGINNVRGYSYNMISPRDEGTGDRIGGTKEFFSNVEVLWPFSKELGLMGVAFFDAGNAWNNGEWWFTDPERVGSDDLPLGLYKGVGAGIRWYSPMGPLRLEYGYGLDELKDSGRHKIEFSMGQFF